MRKIILAPLLLCTTLSFSQSLSPFTLNNGGGSKAIMPNFILDWSIGESTSVETYNVTAPPGILYVSRYWNITSGVLQPINKTNIFNPIVRYWTAAEIKLYPVPTSNVVTIDFQALAAGKISIQLLDLSGKTLDVKEFYYGISNEKYRWYLSKHTSGIYFFKILLTSPQGDILKQGTFKIEKIN